MRRPCAAGSLALVAAVFDHGAKGGAPRKAKGCQRSLRSGGNALAVGVRRFRFGRLRASRVLDRLRGHAPTSAEARPGRGRSALQRCAPPGGRKPTRLREESSRVWRERARALRTRELDPASARARQGTSSATPLGAAAEGRLDDGSARAELVRARGLRTLVQRLRFCKGRLRRPGGVWGGACARGEHARDLSWGR